MPSASARSNDAWVAGALGLSQLINWGVSFYLLGAFGPAMAEDLGWRAQQVFAGLSVAMVVMGLVSPLTAGLLERFGGRSLLRCATLLNVCGCLLLARCELTLPVYYLIWTMIGVGMRLSLYDALFACLAGLGVERARMMTVRITLIGGLASAVFWPLGQWLHALTGWRDGLLIYAALGLVSVGLLQALPVASAVASSGLSRGEAQDRGPAPMISQCLYCLNVTLVGVLSAGLSSQLPSLLAAWGAPMGLVALWGIGQTCARLLQSLVGRSAAALSLNVWVGLGLPLCFGIGLLSQGNVGWVALFVFGYGALNGLSTLLRAGLPFELFAHAQYARLTGKLVAPGFMLSAFAPWCFAAVGDHAGALALLWLALSIGLGIFSVAIVLKVVGGKGAVECCE